MTVFESSHCHGLQPLFSDLPVIAFTEISSMEAVLGLRVMSNVVNTLDRAIDRRTCAAGQLVKLVKPEPREGIRGKGMMMGLTGE
jgi:hypothetical protein